MRDPYKLIKITLLGTLLSFLATSTTFADAYIGINLGGHLTTFKKNLTYPLSRTPPTQSTSKNDYTGFHGETLLGYQFPPFHRFNIALEGNVGINTGSTDTFIKNWFLTKNAGVKEKLKYQYGLYLSLNYKLIQETSLFVGAGITEGKFSFNSISDTGGNIGVTGNFNSWLNGVGFKSGASIKLTSRSHLLLTYQYSKYRSIHLQSIEPLSEKKLSAHYRPTVHALTIGLKYNLPF